MLVCQTKQRRVKNICFADETSLNNDDGLTIYLTAYQSLLWFNLIPTLDYFVNV